MAGLLLGLARGGWGSSGHCLELCLQDGWRTQPLLAPGLKALGRPKLFPEQPVAAYPLGAPLSCL